MRLVHFWGFVVSLEQGQFRCTLPKDVDVESRVVYLETKKFGCQYIWMDSRTPFSSG